MPNWPTPITPGVPVAYLSFYVYSRDPNNTTILQTLYGGYGVTKSPVALRDALGISETSKGFDTDTADMCIKFPMPPNCINNDYAYSGWIERAIQGTLVYPSIDGNSYWWPPLAYKYFLDEDWFEIPGHPAAGINAPGLPGIFIWSAVFLTMGGVGANPSVSYTEPICKRRFINGFELTNGSFANDGMEAEDNNPATWITRDASRTPDGYGLARRGRSLNVRHKLDYYGVVTNEYKSWERIYIRLRTLPTINASIINYWGDSSQSGFILVSTTGQLGINIPFSAYTVWSSGTLLLNTWYRLDTLLIFNDGVSRTDLFLDLYINGALFLSGNAKVSDSSGVVHTRSEISESLFLSSFEMDYDDWSNREHPSDNAGPQKDIPKLQRRDWFFGSHIQKIPVKSIVSAGSWTGNYSVANQNPSSAVFTLTGGNFSSSSNADKIKFDTLLDGVSKRFDLVRQFGVVSVLGGATIQTPTLVANLSIDIINSTGNKLTTKTSNGTDPNGISSLVTPAAGLMSPVSVEPIQIEITHSTDTNVNKIFAANALVEFMGSYGNCDDLFAYGTDVLDAVGIHNAPYFTSSLAYKIPPLLDALVAVGGTYVGNGTTLNLVIDAPAVHWLWVRPLAAGPSSLGGRWFSSLLSAHLGSSVGNFEPGFVSDIITNDDGTTSIIIGPGNGNVNTIAYQYVVFCDSASRIMLNGAFRHNDVNPVDNLLFNSLFTPEFAWLYQESNNGPSGVINFFTKNQAVNASNNANNMGTTQSSNIANLSTGKITSYSGINVNLPMSYSAWRSNDGTIPLNPVYIGSYIGNGAGNRDISVNLGGRRPLWAFIQGVNFSIGALRDPSHASNLSSNTEQSNNALVNYIRGADIDIIKIGSSLNTNAITYSIFAIPAGTDAGNDGWGTNGSWALAQSGWDPNAFPPQFIAPPPEPGPVNIIGSGGLTLSGDPGMLILKSISGLYVITPGKTNDTLYDRQVDQESIDVEIPTPMLKTGFVGDN